MTTDPTPTGPELIFEEPPPQTRRRGNSPVGLWLASLREHPGQWAKYPERVGTGTASNIKRGKGLGVTPGEFEVVTRNQADDKCWMYARYAGGES